MWQDALGLQFLVAGAREYGETGVLVTFERPELAALQDEGDAQQAELKRAGGRDERLAADSQAAWQAIGTPRWADPDEDGDEEER